MTPPRRLVPRDVEDAAAIVGRHLRPTPLRPSFALRGHDAWLKLECWQPTGSFKVRGAVHNVATLSDDEKRLGIVAASAGNHALGVAFAARAIGGVRTSVFVPTEGSSSAISRAAVPWPAAVRGSSNAWT